LITSTSQKKADLSTANEMLPREIKCDCLKKADDSKLSFAKELATVANEPD
jgi:hypothetical protein